MTPKNLIDNIVKAVNEDNPYLIDKACFEWLKESVIESTNGSTRDTCLDAFRIFERTYFG